ncbi:hypothetical protein BGZ46_000086 [Entomortierella lignicola]|nr:hypothetical protein BGZ46_000086 [Entomortierella lignicola]
MGVAGQWSLIGRAYKVPKVNLPPDKLLLVGLFRAFLWFVCFNLTTKNEEEAYNAIDKILCSHFASKENVVIFIDGQRTQEKEKTAQVRFTRSRTQLLHAKKIVDEMEENAKIGKAISSAKHKRCSQYLSQSVMLIYHDCINLFNGLKSRGWDVVLGPGEADLTISKRFSTLPTPHAVVTDDGDLLAYGSVPVIYRPFRREFYEYGVDECAKALGILRLQLTTLSIVSKNDYTSNPSRLGVATNLEIIKDMKSIKLRDYLKKTKDEMAQNAQARREVIREHKAQAPNPFRHGKHQTFNKYRTINQALSPQKPQVGTPKSSTAGQFDLDCRRNYTCCYAMSRILCSDPVIPKPDREPPSMKLFHFKEHIGQYNTDTDTDTEEKVKADEFGRADSKKFFNTLLINMRNSTTPTKSPLSAVFKLYYSKKIPRQRDMPVYNKEKQYIYSSALIQSIGDAITVQYKRYFKETDANKNSSLPLVLIKNGLTLISEHELLSMLWGSNVMRKHLGKDGLASRNSTDISKFMKCRAPGEILNKCLTPIGLGRGRAKGSKSGYQRQTTTMPVKDMREHMGRLRNEESGLEYLQGYRYVLRVSFLTNGLQLQLNVINTGIITKHKYSAARSRHKPDIILMHDPREGYDSYLTEVRNVFPDKNAVERVFKFKKWDDKKYSEDIDVLAIDLEEAFTVGAYARRAKARGSNLRLGINSKQRRASERLKNPSNSLMDCPSQPSSQLSKLCRGPEGKYESRYRVTLNKFYNGNSMKYLKHDRDAGKAHKAEFALLTDRLLSMVGSSIGKKRSEGHKVVIGVGLGRFGTHTKLTSLHSAFGSYFIAKAGTITQLYCGWSERPSSAQTVNDVGPKHSTLLCFHRDQMAARNMVSVINGHLDPGVRRPNGNLGSGHRRPVYLCPIDGWSNKKIEKRKATSDRELSSEPVSSSERSKESPSKPGPQTRRKGKAGDEAEAQAAPKSKPNGTAQDNLDGSGSEYSKDDDNEDSLGDNDEDGEYEPEENDQEEEEDEDAESYQFETDESDRDDEED